MAEIATIARPYAEALLKASADGNAAALAAEVGALAQVAADPGMRQFSDDPKAQAAQVLDVLMSVAKTPSGASPGEAAKNLVRTVIENGRLSALPEIARQFQALVDAKSGTSQATVESAFPIDASQLAEVKTAMERRFLRNLDMHVVVKPELIGGVRVIVGDEVLDTSIRARLEQMKAALVA
ncbi:MAG: F0F1 ATP synthase subunit delta [Burkholderiales bacterium]|nr:F0F1 ATP synthase subunit delta [Burkholderiales bacterium]